LRWLIRATAVAAVAHKIRNVTYDSGKHLTTNTQSPDLIYEIP